MIFLAKNRLFFCVSFQGKGYNMKPKLKKLIQLLLEVQPRTSANLAERLDVSVRSVKNYVREINEEFPNTIQSSYEGYRIDSKVGVMILADNTNHIPQTSDERVSYIINKLINHNSHVTLDTYDLCDELFVSMSTLKNELTKVKHRLQKFDLQLITKGDFIECSGLEKNKRKMLSTILYDESNVNFVNIESLQHAFMDIDIDFIRRTILEVFDKYHCFINDYSLINLVLHVTIAVDRIINDNINKQNVDSLPGVRLHEYALAQEIAEKLNEHFNIEFSNAEIYEMTLLIISRATTIDYKSITVGNLEEFVGKDCLDLVKILIENVNAFYYIDLSEPEFLIRFALHIRNLLVRSKNDYFSKNPLTESIKSSCPLIYDLSVNLAEEIKEYTSITINDDEIAYIAFHLGSTIEAHKSLTTKITAALYCPNYYDINQKVTDTLNQYFSNDLLVKYIVTDESELEAIQNIDLIISTIPLSRPQIIPSVLINIFVTKRDQDILKQKIDELHKEKDKKEFNQYLREMILPEFFERKNDLHTQIECIDYMYQKFKNKGYVNTSFKEEVLKRERISSTAFGNFAIPHAMKMYANKTGINIIISDQPIQWSDKSVNLVIMMCFNKNERYMFNEIYEPITMILSESENVKKILTSKDYDEFIQNLVNLL